MIRRAAWLMIVCGCVTAHADDAVKVETTNAVSNFFPGKPLRREIAVTAGDDAWSGLVSWRLIAGQRTLASRSIAVELKSGERQKILAEFTLPETMSDAGVPLEFLVAAVVKEGAEPVAELREVLWALAENPFAERLARLKELPLTLFDPEGNTKAAFDAMEIPYEPAVDLNGVVNCKQGVLILGEGIRYQDWRGVIHESLLLSRKDVSVICLAAAEGEELFPWEALSAEETRIHKSRFERRAIIRELAPRISLAWNPSAAVEAANLTFAARNNEVFAQAAPPDQGWPWLELRHERALHPHWIYCGFGVIRDWNETPAARHFLVRMIDYVTLETHCKPLSKPEKNP